MIPSRKKLNNMVILEFDGANGWEKYLLTYSEALALIPMIAPKLPSITITDYEYNKISREDYKKADINLT